MRNPKPTNFSTVLKKAERKKFYLDPDLHIETFAREINTNRTYLSTYLHQVKGVSFTDYVNTLRLDRAVKLLEKGKHHHTKVATMVGYTSEYTFRRLFKERFGMTPNDFAKQKKQEKEEKKQAAKQS